MGSYNFPAYVNQTILRLLIMTWTDSCHSRAQQPRSSIKVVPFMYLKCMLRKGNAYFMLFLISFHNCCTYYRCTYANIVVSFCLHHLWHVKDQLWSLIRENLYYMFLSSVRHFALAEIVIRHSYLHVEI